MSRRPAFLVPLALLAACVAGSCGDGDAPAGDAGPLQGRYVGQEIWVSYGPARGDEAVRRTGRTREKAESIAHDLHLKVAAGADIGKLAMRHSNAPLAAGRGYTGKLPVDPAHPNARERALASVPIGGLTPVFEWNEGFGFARRVDLVTGEALEQAFLRAVRLRARFRAIAFLYRGAWIADAQIRDKVTRTRAQAVARADSVLKELKAGASFEELAGRLSEDEGSARRGGLVTLPNPDGDATEWIRREDPRIPASVLEAAFTTPVGELCPEVIVSPRGVFLVKVEGRKEVRQ